MVTRTLERVIASAAASEGAGVKLRRSLGSTASARHDPFLILMNTREEIERAIADYRSGEFAKQPVRRLTSA